MDAAEIESRQLKRLDSVRDTLQHLRDLTGPHAEHVVYRIDLEVLGALRSLAYVESVLDSRTLSREFTRLMGCEFTEELWGVVKRAAQRTQIRDGRG